MFVVEQVIEHNLKVSYNPLYRLTPWMQGMLYQIEFQLQEIAMNPRVANTKDGGRHRSCLLHQMREDPVISPLRVETGILYGKRYQTISCT